MRACFSVYAASVSASHELATLRQELDAVKTDLQQTAADRLQLAAQLEVRHTHTHTCACTQVTACQAVVGLKRPRYAGYIAGCGTNRHTDTQTFVCETHTDTHRHTDLCV